jgi:enoyl-CoA hydratase/carnithine racemase
MSDALDEMFEIERRDSTLILRMNRPQRRNAVSQDVWLGFPDLVARINAMADLRMVVLTSSTAGMFSSGADLVEFQEVGFDVEWSINNQRAVGVALQALSECVHPTLAAIDGPAIGAGAALAIVCDFRIATPSSIFAIPPAKLGIVYPQFATVALVALVGERHARSLLLTARTIAADKAAQMGLIDDVVEDLESGVTEFARHFSKTSPATVRLLKQSIRRAVNDPTALSDDLVRAAVTSADFREGVYAFIERRAPNFTAQVGQD